MREGISDPILDRAPRAARQRIAPRLPQRRPTSAPPGPRRDRVLDVAVVGAWIVIVAVAVWLVAEAVTPAAVVCRCVCG